MGATSFLFLVLTVDKVKKANIMRTEAMARQPHLYQTVTSHDGFLQLKSHKQACDSGGPKSATVGYFFLLFFFFFLTCFWEKNKKQQRDCFTHWLAAM
jgi:hypothetical protein